MMTTNAAMFRAFVIYTLTLLFGLFATSFCAPTPAPNPNPNANPSSPNNLIVFNPTITSPTKGVVWRVGTTQEVTWETDNIPQAARNNSGMVVLGYYEGGNPNGSEHLDTEHPLATGFPLDQGEVSVIVPNVMTKSNYVIVLFGDSGNTSPQFTIRGTERNEELDSF